MRLILSYLLLSLLELTYVLYRRGAAGSCPPGLHHRASIQRHDQRRRHAPHLPHLQGNHLTSTILPDKTTCYQLSFLNFLLAKQPNGPGQFMFGMVETVAPTSFTIDCSLAEEEDTEEVDEGGHQGQEGVGVCVRKIVSTLCLSR